MTLSPEPIVPEPPDGTLVEVRDAMNRRGDFDPSPADYARETDVFEVLTIEGEVLA